MSRRWLILLNLALVFLVLAFAALNLMLLVPSAQARGDSGPLPADQMQVTPHRVAAARLEEEWRRVSWELGRRLPPLEERKTL